MSPSPSGAAREARRYAELRFTVLVDERKVPEDDAGQALIAELATAWIAGFLHARYQP